ncbi:hypothetical protein EDB85DRAFT_432674 [Lactarius pseudohatsudake]|nr:hypothetical protein EDB85DRAFT_432674 [Lactarius pseudohatsudake]
MNSGNNKSNDPDGVETQVDPSPLGEGSPLSPFTDSSDSHPVDFAVSSSEEEPKMTNAGIWSMYNVQAEKHDKQLAERWIGQTRCTLNFAGLFSIVVAAFMVGTDLHKRDSTELLLAQIYLQISGQIINATPLLDIGPLRPNSLAIAVQTLWSLSLILSLACALGAILVQEWCQEYLRYSQCHPQPSTRARIRTYLFNGARNYHMEQVVTALPLFLHLAILLFCAGLVTYFFTLHKVVAYTALAAYSITGALYLFFTILPLVDTSSPFKTPISTFLWRSLRLIQLAILYALRWMMSLVSSESPFFRFRLPKIIKARRERYREGFIRALELDLEGVDPNADAHALRWAVSSLGDDDDALESFIAGIPAFLASESHTYPHFTIGHLLEDRDVRLGWSIGRLLQTCVSPSDNTSTSALAPHVRNRRANACLRAVWAITEKFAGTSSLYWDTLFGAHTADALAALSSNDDAANPTIALIARCTAALATRSCLRELAHVAEWTRTRGPYWAHRARQLAGFARRLGALATTPDTLEDVGRDGALLTLLAFLSRDAAVEADRSVSSMVSTTVRHLADGVRAGDSSLDAQRLFASEAFAVDVCGRWMRFLDPAASRAVRLVADSLATQIRKVLGAADAGDYPVHQEDQGDGAIAEGRNRQAAAGYTRWSYDSSCTAFSGDGTAPGFARHWPSPGDSPLRTVLEAPLLQNRDEHGI